MTIRVHVINSANTLGNEDILASLMGLFDGPVAVAMGYDRFFREKEVILTPTKQQDSDPDCAVIMLHTIMSLVSREMDTPSSAIDRWPTSDLRAWVAILLLIDQRSAGISLHQARTIPAQPSTSGEGAVQRT